MKLNKYQGPLPEGSKQLDTNEEIYNAEGSISAGHFDGLVEGIEKVSLGSLLGTTGVIISIPVDGDSMMGAGLTDGSSALINVNPNQVQNGDCVAVFYKGCYNLKYLRIEDDALWLIPDNPNMAPMKFLAPEKPDICGVCIGALLPRQRLNKHRFEKIVNEAKKIEVYGAQYKAEDSDVKTDVIQKPTMTLEERRRIVFKESLLELFDAKDDTGELIFKRKVHWLAVFHVAVERGYAIEQHYADFDDYLKHISITHATCKYDKDLVSKYDVGVYHLSIEQWTDKIFFEKNIGKKPRPFHEMVKVATKFMDILDEKLEALSSDDDSAM